MINSSPPGHNGRHFADDIFRCISVNELFCILIKISLKCVPFGRIDNSPALVRMMAWCRIRDNPLSEPMMAYFNDAYMRHSASISYFIIHRINGTHGDVTQTKIVMLIKDTLSVRWTGYRDNSLPIGGCANKLAGKLLHDIISTGIEYEQY